MARWSHSYTPQIIINSEVVQIKYKPQIQTERHQK